MGAHIPRLDRVSMSYMFLVISIALSAIRSRSTKGMPNSHTTVHSHEDEEGALRIRIPPP